MNERVLRFLFEEDGASTVEWVVMTASLVGLALAVLTAVGDGLEEQSNRIEGQLLEDHTTARFR